MSQAVSNLCFFPCKTRPLLGNYSSCSKSLKPILNVVSGSDLKRAKKKSMAMKAMAGHQTRDNLDNLQRAPKQSPRKRSAAPTPPIGLWERSPTARTVQQMMEAMERLMEDPFTYSGGGWPSPAGPRSSGRTPWEIKEGEAEYKMRFDMPGMTRDDVKVWVEGKMLVVEARKGIKQGDGDDDGAESSDAGEEWSAKSYGRYSCRIALPENIRFQEIRAEVKDGVLYITIPKASSLSNVLDINVQ